MSIYSKYEVYPSSFDETQENTCCENCSLHCPTILPIIYDDLEMELDTYESIDFKTIGWDIHDLTYQLSGILVESKGYYKAHYDIRVIHNGLEPCIELLYRESQKFITNLQKFGDFEFKVICEEYRPSMCYVFIVKEGKIINPLKLMPYYRRFEVIK